jgi:cytochrome c-type biogenesis protein CcmF
MEKRGALKVWTVLLAILTFSLSLLGTFLVRSGVLTSVHSFASDPTRGVFILGILTAFIGGALALFAWRAPDMKQGGLFAPVSREGALVFNNLFLVAAAATVLVGTLYPLALEAVTGQKISVGAPFFNLTFGPLMIPLLLAVPFGPLLAWKRGDLQGTAQRLGVAMLAALAAVAITLVVAGAKGVLAPFGLGLGVWLICGSLADLAERTQIGRVGAATSLSRFAGLPRSALGTMVAHAGMGLTVIGIVATSAYQTESIAALKPGETMGIGGYVLQFQGSAPATGPNYREERAKFLVSKDGSEPFPLTPAKRFYEARQMATTEAAIKTTGFSQLYVSLGDATPEGGLAVRASYKPLVTLIWLGALVMSCGGALSLSDRRLRIGAPRRAAPRSAEAAAA